MPALRQWLLFAVLVALPPLHGQSAIERLGQLYNEDLDGTTATLTYWPTETTTNLIFKCARPAKELPPLDVQCRLLDRLLPRVLKDHPTESEFVVTLGPIQELLLPGLQKFLASSPAWDSLHGRPFHAARLGDFLTEALNKSGTLDPVANVFQRHGFTLFARGMNRIEIERIPAMKNARLPSYIWEMDFAANKRM